MNRKFDVTTATGILAALKFMGEDDSGALRLGMPLGPVDRFVARKLHAFLTPILATTESTLEKQKQAAIDIIKAGKDSGVESLEVTLDQQVGLHFGSNVEGIPIKATMGKSGNMTIKVTYK